MAKVIAIANQKGGVAKTTTTFNLGAGLVGKGKKVLLIDTDPQGSLTIAMGFDKDALDVSLYDIMVNILQKEDFPCEMGILHHQEGIDLMPCNGSMTDMQDLLTALRMDENELVERRPNHVLKTYVEKLSDAYDYILLDSGPTLGILMTNVMIAADSIIIPTNAEALPEAGLYDIIHTIEDLRHGYNPHLAIEGILITKYDTRPGISKFFGEKISLEYKGYKVYDFRIPLRSVVNEAISYHSSIFAYKKKDKKLINSYQRLVEEVNGRG